jgi:hypothetical protein
MSSYFTVGWHTLHLVPCALEHAQCRHNDTDSDRMDNLAAEKKFQQMRHVTVGYGTKTLKTLSGLTRGGCWQACVDLEGCQSALFVRSTYPRSCQLLDSVAEHRLITIPRASKSMLLYSANRREMELPPIGWNDTRTGLGVQSLCLRLRLHACVDGCL